MDTHILEKARNLNKFSPTPIILDIAERFVYRPDMGTFDNYIRGVILGHDGFNKVFNFASERALDCAIDYMNKNPNFKMRELIKYVK